MKVAAVVPFKCFTRGKNRLRARYADSEVEQILHALLLDVLGALGCAREVDHLAVLTDDEAVARVARAAGADVCLRTPDPGLNEAIELAAAELEAAGYEALLVVLGDLPLLRGADVDEVVKVGEQHEIVLVPSSDGGTALLLLRPPRRIPPRFGPNSASRHAEAARKAELRAFEPDSPEEICRVDLDTPEDAERILASGIPCRTRDVLLKLAR
ncbi:MAG: 2-phospho-L-lactate guanylyltransferase [Myxococcota bacterium]